MNAKEAQELAASRNDRVIVDEVSWAHGWIAALSGPEVVALVEALEDIAACTPDATDKAIAEKAIATFRAAIAG